MMLPVLLIALDSLLPSGDALRIANVVLSVIAVVTLMAVGIGCRDELTVRERRIGPWFTAILVVIAYGSGEAAHGPAVDPGLRVGGMLVSLLGLVVAIILVLHTEHRLRKRSHPGA